MRNGLYSLPVQATDPDVRMPDTPEETEPVVQPPIGTHSGDRYPELIRTGFHAKCA